MVRSSGSRASGSRALQGSGMIMLERGMREDFRTVSLRRSRLYRETREFFFGNGYLEVETPTLADGLIPESTIPAFETTFTPPFSPHRPQWLIPSPEVHMKQLLAEGSGSIFQISRCFRNSEQIGAYHNPEFTMLEWYTVHAKAADSILHTEKFFDAVIKEGPDHLRPPFKVRTMTELCFELAGFDLEKNQSLPQIRSTAAALGLTITGGKETWESLFNRIFLTFVEPNLPQEKPLVITDYPAQIACLAARKRGTPYLDRWELYAGGMELANCYTEEGNPQLVQDYLTREQALVAGEAVRDPARALPDIPEGFLDHFNNPETHFPDCSGAALGMDRLLMLIGGHSHIGGVILFPYSDRIS